MLTQENIDDINVILNLCNATRLNTNEVDFLNAIGAESTTNCDNYTISQMVLVNRSKNSTTGNDQLSRLKMLSSANGCELEDKKAVEKTPNIPIYGGGL